MSEVFLKRFYFALFDDGLTLKTLKLAFIEFWIFLNSSFLNCRPGLRRKSTIENVQVQKFKRGTRLVHMKSLANMITKQVEAFAITKVLPQSKAKTKREVKKKWKVRHSWWFKKKMRNKEKIRYTDLLFFRRFPEIRIYRVAIFQEISWNQEIWNEGQYFREKIKCTICFEKKAASLLTFLMWYFIHLNSLSQAFELRYQEH